MNKKVIFVFLIVFALSTFLIQAESETSPMDQYNSIVKDFKAKYKTIKSRKEYMELKKERDNKLSDLLEKIAGKKDEQNQLLSGNIYLEMGNPKQAIQNYEAVIQLDLKNKDQGSFGKVRCLLEMDQTDQAVAVFKAIEDKINKDDDYMEALIYFGYSDNLKTAENYSKKFIKLAGSQKQYQGYKSMMYTRLAELKLKAHKKQEAVKILEDAKKEFKDERALQSIEAKLKQVALYDVTAPAIKAEKWLHSAAVDLASLKGKVVLIDFWAPWCPPCRKVIPSLVKLYDELKTQGLAVIGFTRIYGSYRDDVQNKGKVPKEEEIKLIGEFCKKWNISYPVAIADTTDVFNTYGVSGIPTMIVINKKGNVEEIHVGSGSETELSLKVKEMLKK